MKATQRWLVLLLALLATVACLTEASSWIASSHSTDSPSWRINTSPDAWSERGDRCDYSADTLDGAETLKEDGFNRKPLCDKTVLVLYVWPFISLEFAIIELTMCMSTCFYNCVSSA